MDSATFRSTVARFSVDSIICREEGGSFLVRVCYDRSQPFLFVSGTEEVFRLPEMFSVFGVFHLVDDRFGCAPCYDYGLLGTGDERRGVLGRKVALLVGEFVNI